MKNPTRYGTAQTDGLSIFYREAGRKDAPVLLLLHGLPSSSRLHNSSSPHRLRGEIAVEAGALDAKGALQQIGSQKILHRPGQRG